MRANLSKLTDCFDHSVKPYIAASSKAIFRYSCDLLSAAPNFLGDQFAKQSSIKIKAPPIFWQMFLLILNDVVPIMMCSWLFLLLTQTTEQSEKNVRAESIASQITVSILYFLSAVFIFRQKMRFLIHTSVLSIAYAKAYGELTDKKREKVDAEVCKSCTTGRYIKGDLRAAIVFIMQTLMISSMEWIPLMGSSIAAFSRILLMGQVITEYRLANDKICDRHRAEYFHHHYLFILTLGSMHYIPTRYLSEKTQSILGIERLQIEPYISSILMLFFIGITHQMRLPKSIEKATRHFYDPLMIMRAAISILFDLMTPGIKKLFDKKVIDEKGEKKRRLEWEKFKNQIIAFYQNDFAQWTIKLLLPSLCRDLNKLKKDWIIKDYWPAVSEKLADYMTRILSMRDPALKLDSLRGFYVAYIVPVQEVAGVLGLFLAVCTPVLLPIKIFAKSISAISTLTGLQNNASKALPVVAHKSESIKACIEFVRSMPKGLGFLLIALLRDEVFIADFSALRKKLSDAAGDYHSERVIDMPPNSQPFRLRESEYFNVPPQPNPSEFDLVDRDEISRQPSRVTLFPNNARHSSRRSSQEFENVTSDPEEFEQTYSSSRFPKTPHTQPSFN